MLEGTLPPAVTEKLDAFKAEMMAQKPKLATRKTSEMVLQVINDATDMTDRRLGRPHALESSR